MTLRLRLTLTIALAVALVLLASGIALHLLLRASLYRGVDERLGQAAVLLSRSIDTEVGSPELELEGEVPSGLGGDLTALLLDDQGVVLSRLGASLGGVPKQIIGYSTQDDVRVLAERVPGGTLLVARDLDSVEDALERFDAVFWTLAPVALLVAVVLGYGLAGRGLAPVDRLTRASLDLAERRAWRERLPEPARQDELWRLARATNSLLGALAQVIESERRFTADAAHELRTPLTVLRGRLEQALEGTSDKETRARLQRALTANEELIHLTETLLLLARTEAGQGRDFEQVALDEVAFNVVEVLRPLFREKGLALEVSLPQTPVWVSGDAGALTVLVRNLLDNALKFTERGEVRLEVRRDGAQARLRVTDTGPGFPEEHPERVFERFYQAEVRHRQGGSGLGPLAGPEYRPVARRQPGGCEPAGGWGQRDSEAILGGCVMRGLC